MKPELTLMGLQQNSSPHCSAIKCAQSVNTYIVYTKSTTIIAASFHPGPLSRIMFHLKVSKCESTMEDNETNKQ